MINITITCMLATDAQPQGWRATLIYDNQMDLIQYDCWNEKETEMTSNAKEIKVIYYGLLNFEQVFKKMQDQAVMIRSEFTAAVYDIGKWKAKESLIERIKQVFYLVEKFQLQITTVHIPRKLNSTTDSLSRICRLGDYTLNDGMIQMICRTQNYMLKDKHIRNIIWQTNQQICINGSQRPGDTLPQCVQLQMEQSQTIHPPTNTGIKQRVSENEIKQCRVNNNCTDLALTIVIHQTNEFIHQIPFPWISRQDSGDGIENERQGSKAFSTQCGRLPSRPIADLGEDLIMRYMKMREFTDEGVHLLFKGQRELSIFNNLKIIQHGISKRNNTTQKIQNIWKSNPNDIAEIRLKFPNVNKTDNQTSPRLAPKQANAIEAYEIYETDNEKLSPKLVTFDWIDRLKKFFPKGASAYSIRHSATTELAKLDTQFNLSLSWPELLVNYLAISFALIEDAKIQYC
ncbi:MAG: hypothetical protein EZS28_024221 [Streblomastix strix]|uniref:Uncharacterized protein n=1 Tax=Streblomastix strix TaxID=222440 RepID=A0A5J4VCP3_9EUKA|nr:MAG: hypothetical protein EZS28_024221 [Streblomastix strix]